MCWRLGTAQSALSLFFVMVYSSHHQVLRCPSSHLSAITCHLSFAHDCELSYHSELLLVVAGRVEGEQRAVVTDLALPVSVEIVRHHVDHVHMPARGNTTIRFLGHSEVWLS